jgi:hypothetical protein
MPDRTPRNIELWCTKGFKVLSPSFKNFRAFKIVAAHGDIVGDWLAGKGGGVASDGLEKAVRVHLQVQRIVQVFVGKLLVAVVEL